MSGWQSCYIISVEVVVLLYRMVLYEMGVDLLCMEHEKRTPPGLVRDSASNRSHTGCQCVQPECEGRGAQALYLSAGYSDLKRFYA